MIFPPHQGSIASLTPTLCHLLGVMPPSVSEEPALDMVISTLEEEDLPLEKCLIIAQDAIGAHLWGSHENELRKILPLVPLRVPLRAVFPPVTPVCFASIFTGAQPVVHGIHRYTRPVLECDTIFDALVRADKKVAIVSVENSSIDLIFRNRYRIGLLFIFYPLLACPIVDEQVVDSGQQFGFFKWFDDIIIYPYTQGFEFVFQFCTGTKYYSRYMT